MSGLAVAGDRVAGDGPLRVEVDAMSLLTLHFDGQLAAAGIYPG
jgi:hypothetical protein